MEFLESPATVSIVASPPEPNIEYGWLGLGTWKAQLKSAHGKSQREFNLSFSGPNGDWLAANFIGKDAEIEDDYYGHREGNFLAFTKTLRQPDGKQVKTFFIGIMSGDKIVGTSVDEAGIKGEWMAVRITETPKP